MGLGAAFQGGMTLLEDLVDGGSGSGSGSSSGSAQSGSAQTASTQTVSSSTAQTRDTSEGPEMNHDINDHHR